jgi:hypothetical protein
MSASSDLAQFLITNGVGILNQTIFWDYQPDTPVTIPTLALIEYPGPPGCYVYERRRMLLDFPKVQVSAYAVDVEDAIAFANAAYQLLDQQNITLSGTAYTMIRPMQTPGNTGLDAASRKIIGFNVETRRLNA